MSTENKRENVSLGSDPAVDPASKHELSDDVLDNVVGGYVTPDMMLHVKLNNNPKKVFGKNQLNIGR